MVNRRGAIIENILRKTDLPISIPREEFKVKKLPGIDVYIEKENIDYVLKYKLNQDLSNIEAPIDKNLNGIDDLLEEISIKYEGPIPSDVSFESSTPGEYSVDIVQPGNYEVILIGAGGGGLQPEPVPMQIG